LNWFKESRGRPEEDGTLLRRPRPGRRERTALPEPSPRPCDLRALDPPEPLLRILATVESGDPGPLVFLLAREPHPLYPLLAAAGWRHGVRRLQDGVELTVFREAPVP
jgi:hypothetical protein